MRSDYGRKYDKCDDMEAYYIIFGHMMIRGGTENEYGTLYITDMN